MPHSTQPKQSDAIATSLARNVTSILTWEFFWGIGMPCCLIATVMPSYLQQLGSSVTLIQSLTTACAVTGILMLWSGKLIHGPRRRNLSILYWISYGGIFILYALAALIGFRPGLNWLWIIIFSVLCLGQAVLANLAGPVSEEIILQNIPLHRRGTVLSLRLVVLGLSGILGFFLAIRLFHLWPLPVNYHVRFLIGGAVLALSCLAFMVMRDHAAATHKVAAPVSLRVEISAMIGNFNFRILLVFHAILMAALSLAPLLITYGRSHLGMEQQADYFTVAFFVGNILLGILVSPLADRFGFRLIGAINAVLLSMAFICPIIAGRNIWVLLFGYCFCGACANLSWLVLANLGSEILPDFRPSIILGLGTAITLPLALLIAPLSGVLVDVLGLAGYTGAFMIGATLSICALIGFAFIIREPRTGQELTIVMRRI